MISMTWILFVYFYSAITFLLLIAFRAVIPDVIRFGKAVFSLTSIVFVWDYIAEHRGFWKFPFVTGVKVLDVPIENIAFTAATAVNVLLIYLKVRCWFARRRVELQM